MKFGKTFLAHQVPEWSHSYMNYKELKRQIKTIVARQKGLETHATLEHLNEASVKALLATFFFALDRNLEKVDDFYNQQFAEYERRLRKLTAIVEANGELGNTAAFDEDEAEEIISAFLELRNGMRNLKWFGELNKRAFQKILKKLDKKASTLQRMPYLTARVAALPFAHESEILQNLVVINTQLELFTTIVTDLRGALENPAPPAESAPPFQESKSGKFTGALAEDDDEAMLAQLIGEYQSPVLAPHRLLLSLLNQATLLNATRCIDKLLPLIPSLAHQSDVTSRNYFHHHVVALGKSTASLRKQSPPLPTSPQPLPRNFSSIQPASMLSSAHQRLNRTYGPDGVNSNDSRDGLAYVLEHLPAHLRPALLQRDSYKRTPLHYAAQYGLRAVTQLLVEYLEKWGEWQRAVSIDLVEHWGDSEGLTPLHLAVLGSHPLTAALLLLHCDGALSCPALILLAAKLEAVGVLAVLLQHGIDVNYTDAAHNNETALFIASKLNCPPCVELLLANGADTELGEAAFGWTPLFVAAASGHQLVVDMLVEAKARFDHADESGWLPMEHACLRGHLAIADQIRPAAYSPTSSSMALPEQSPPAMYQLRGSPVSSIDKLPETNAQMYLKLKRQASPPQIRSFGHRYLEPKERLVLISLGSADSRLSEAAFVLNKVPVSRVHATELDTALSVVVGIRGSTTPAVTLDLPLDDARGGATEPLQFGVEGAFERLMVSFDIVPTYQAGDAKPRVLGRAVAFVDNLYSPMGPDRQALNQLVTVPVLEAESLEILGSVRFECTVVTPFVHPQMAVGHSETYWKSLITTRVIGHRGMGKNINTRTSLQLGENTVESFIAAASLGASYVEFDVQLTKDLVPVVYHDFLVAESGLDVPMHALTAEQFLGLGDASTSHVPPTSFRLRAKSQSFEGFKPTFLEEDPLVFGTKDRMKHTKTWKEKGFKGNARGSSIASPFVTLVELFQRLPALVGFNIECKYPMLDEAQLEGMGEVAIDMNRWVDTVLETVYNHANGRDVIFSSFHPDICIMLSLKQPSIPILFLTEAGTTLMADVRAASLQAAIRFARNWNLLGIVSAAETLVKCPRLTSIVKASGLVCVTYGVSNNDPALSRLQMANGVDAVIVDSVLAVRSGLTKDTDAAQGTV